MKNWFLGLITGACATHWYIDGADMRGPAFVFGFMIVALPLWLLIRKEVFAANRNRETGVML